MAGKRELVQEKKPKFWLIPVIAGMIALGGYAGLCAAAATGDTILPNTYVAGQDLGGMTVREAAASLAPALSRLQQSGGVRPTVAGAAGADFFSYDELGVAFDAESSAEAAYEEGHSGNPFEDGVRLLNAMLGSRTDVAAQPAVTWTDDAVEKIASECEYGAEDFRYEVAENSLVLTKARDGLSVSRRDLKQALDRLDTSGAGVLGVDLPYTPVPADQGDLPALQQRLGGEMANARYDAATDTIIPERPALNFDVAQAQLLLDAAAPGERVVVPATAETPTVTAEELEKVLFRDVLGTYTTRVGGAAGRKANVRLTAQRVNGFVMNSGEEFNYYALTGPFTAANGYQSAPGYLQGKTVEMDGGGACQCSSTTYAAALLANLEIVARQAHGFASDYIGLGMDATVSGGGPEFIFRNNTPYPIKVEAVYSDNNRLTVNILGTKTDDTYVKMRTVVLSSTPFEEEYQESEELAPGERKVEQTAYTGYVVDTYRQIYDGQGKLLSETYEARSRYNKRNRIILVAPGELPGEEAGAEAPATEAPAAEAPAAEAPVPEPPAPEAPAPEPSDIPGGVDPVPIGEQIEQLAPAEQTGGAGV